MPSRLHETCQRFDDQPTRLEVRALIKGVKYVVAVEAFDERGVSELSRASTLEPWIGQSLCTTQKSFCTLRNTPRRGPNCGA
ncbi:MAG TPA: hypothetical protein VL545_09900, partial [Rhodanobacter sp.]|nr:hypothetical protein [Rhodanobacter sp.]